MDNEFVYISTKPFNRYNPNNQTQAIMSTNEDGIEIKVNADRKYNIFYLESNPISKIYTVDSSFKPISIFNPYPISGTINAIPTTTLKSSLYFSMENRIKNIKQVQHFTSKTKITKISYFNDSIERVFGNDSFYADSKHEKDKFKKVDILAVKMPEEKLATINADDNRIYIFLQHDFNYNHKYNISQEITISGNSSIVLKFAKPLTFTKAYKYVLLLDSVFYLMTLLTKRHKKILIHDNRNNIYNCRDSKIEKSNNKVNDRNFLICERTKSKDVFIKIFNTIYSLEKHSKNALFPFLEYDMQKYSLEISFLEYYRTLEFLDLTQRKKIGKGKNTLFLLDIIKNNEDLRKKLFGNQDTEEIEEEIRSLRNYYSHEGYYLDKLPIKRKNKVVRYKYVSINWLRNVLEFVKISAYIEIYKLCGIDITYDKLKYNI